MKHWNETIEKGNIICNTNIDLNIGTWSGINVYLEKREKQDTFSASPYTFYFKNSV
jgi:hypothetical protein